MAEQIRFLSHPGARARVGYDQTFDLIDASALTPVADITTTGYEGVESTTRFFAHPDLGVLRGVPLERQLNDVEPGGAIEGVRTIHFDGDMPADENGCFQVQPMFTEFDGTLMVLRLNLTDLRLLAVWKTHDRWGNTIGQLYFVRKGQPMSPTRSYQSRDSLNARSFLSLEEGAHLLEGSGTRVVLHDPAFGDLDGYLRERAAQLNKRLHEEADKLETLARRIRDYAEGQSEHKPYVSDSGTHQAILELEEVVDLEDALRERRQAAQEF